MRNSQILNLIESRNLTLEEVGAMSSKSRVMFGLPAVIPATDYTPVQRFADSILPRWGGLRSMFGLDQEIVTDPVFNISDDGLKSSQFYRNSLLFNNQRLPIYTLVDEMDTYDLINCLTGETKISLLTGEDVSISDLANRLSGNDFVWVYSYDTKTGKMVPGKAHHPRRTGDKVPVYKITLDNGEAVRATAGHPFLLRDGTYRTVDSLSVGDSLMPLYRMVDKYNYEMFHTGVGKWKWTHREVAEAVYGKIPADSVVHHSSFDSRNNSPDKLVVMRKSEHDSLHRNNGRDNLLKLWASPDFAAKMRQVQKNNALAMNGKVWKDPAHRAKISSIQAVLGSEKMVANWANPEFVEAHVARQKKIGPDRMRRLWATNPEFAANVKAAAKLQVKKIHESGKHIHRGADNYRWMGNVTIESIMDCISRGICSVKDVANALNCSVPTITRRCRASGTSFTKLRKEIADMPNQQRLALRVGESCVNHSVVSIEPDGCDDVYDITVDDYHNFALTAGVFVHNSALDLYTEEATQPDPDTQRVVWIESDDGSVRAELMDLLNRLNMDDRAYGIIRTMCKYGDDFERVITADTIGVVRLAYIHPARLSRIEDREGRLQGFAAGILSPEECDWESIKDPQRVSQPWDFVHFRLMSNNRDSKHGDSILLGSRRAYQQLKMIEDMLVLYRLARGMDRDVYYVNTNGATMTQAWRTMHEFRQEVRKRLAINPAAGSMRQEYNMRTPDEDLFLPVNGKDDPTRVERQQGGQPQGDIDDVDHFRRKLLGSLRIPGGYIGFENDSPSRSTLASQDIRFARGVKKIQRAFCTGVRWISEIHMIKKGTTTRDELGRMLLKFKVRMAPVTQLEEAAKVEIYTARIQLISEMMALIAMQQQPDPTTGLILPSTGVIKNVDQWSAWVLRKFLGLTDAEIGLFLGDPMLGLTSDDLQIRELTELAEKNGLMTKTQNKLKTLREYIELRRDDDDDEAFIPVKRESSFDLTKVENALRESRAVDGPLASCPACHQMTLQLRKTNEMIGRQFVICRCGYAAMEEENG